MGHLPEACIGWIIHLYTCDKDVQYMNYTRREEGREGQSTI